MMVPQGPLVFGPQLILYFKYFTRSTVLIPVFGIIILEFFSGIGRVRAPITMIKRSKVVKANYLY